MHDSLVENSQGCRHTPPDSYFRESLADRKHHAEQRCGRMLDDLCKLVDAGNYEQAESHAVSLAGALQMRAALGGHK